MHGSVVVQRLSSAKSSTWICMQPMLRCTINKGLWDLMSRMRQSAFVPSMCGKPMSKVAEVCAL